MGLGTTLSLNVGPSTSTCLSTTGDTTGNELVPSVLVFVVRFGQTSPLARVKTSYPTLLYRRLTGFSVRGGVKH